MILKDITNKPCVSIKDFSKSPKSCSTFAEEKEVPTACQITSDILDFTERMATSPQYSFTGPEDPLFVARCNEVEWIFSTRSLLDLHEDTIFHAAAYLDKYIIAKNPSVSKLQLVAMTCLVMASKMNEIYPVYFSNIISMFRVPYKCEQFIEMESQIMQAFDFQFPSVAINELFSVYLMKFKLPKNILKKESVISILQNVLLDYEMMTYDIKCAAMSAVSIAAKMKRLSFILSSEISLKKQYKCAYERLSEVIGQLRAKFTSKNKINSPENSNKSIEL